MAERQCETRHEFLKCTFRLVQSINNGTNKRLFYFWLKIRRANEARNTVASVNQSKECQGLAVEHSLASGQKYYRIIGKEANLVSSLLVVVTTMIRSLDPC